MLAVFLVTLPFFALIALGHAAARRGALPLASIPGLNLFVLFFALPCMLFRFGAGSPVGDLLDGAVVLVWGISGLLLVGIATVLARQRGLSWNDAAFGALVAAFPNTGFMGLPLVVAILGPRAASPMMVTIAFDMLVTTSVCIMLSRLDGAGAQGALRAVRRAIAGILQNPMPWAIVLGGLASARGWALPGPVARTIAMLGDAASPVALFTIGAVLARAGLASREHRASATVSAAMAGQSVPAPRATPGDLATVVVLKLVVHPLLVFGLAQAGRALGLALAPETLTVVVLVAALPSASNVSMLAERFDADNDRIARIILWTTVAAFFAFPAVVALLR